MIYLGTQTNTKTFETDFGFYYFYLYFWFLFDLVFYLFILLVNENHINLRYQWVGSLTLLSTVLSMDSELKKRTLSMG